MPSLKILLRLAAIVGFGLALTGCYYHAPGGHYAHGGVYSYKSYPAYHKGHGYGHGKKFRHRHGHHRPHRGRYY